MPISIYQTYLVKFVTDERTERHDSLQYYNRLIYCIIQQFGMGGIFCFIDTYGRNPRSQVLICPLYMSAFITLYCSLGTIVLHTLLSCTIQSCENKLQMSPSLPVQIYRPTCLSGQTTLPIDNIFTPQLNFSNRSNFPEALH